MYLPVSIYINTGVYDALEDIEKTDFSLLKEEVSLKYHMEFKLYKLILKYVHV